MENLTQQEKEMVKNALMFVYDTKLESIAKNRKIIFLEENIEMLKTANQYYDLTDKFR